MSKKKRAKKRENDKKVKKQEKKAKMYGDKIVKVTLRPLEPYFFGGVNANNGSERKYLIKSKKMPSQTTLFGILRYLCIENPDESFCLSDKNKKRMGENSFSIINEDKNGDKFGKIKAISPLFLSKKDDDDCLIQAPKDYECTPENLDENGKLLKYSPLKFEEYYVLGQEDKIIPKLGDPKKYISKEFIKYDNKKYLEAWINNSEMNFINQKFYDRSDENNGTDGNDNHSMFRTQSKIGIKVSEGEKTDENFYRKEFAIMEDYSFSFFAKVNFKDGDAFYSIKDKIVFMGQGKSTFSASVEFERTINPAIDKGSQISTYDEDKPLPENENEKGKVKSYRKYYAMSDVYLGDLVTVENDFCAMKDVLKKLNVTYVFSGIEPYRQLISSDKGRYSKQANQLNMISAGSVFIVDESKCKFFEKTINNEHLRVVGLNNVIAMADEVSMYEGIKKTSESKIDSINK